MTTTSFLPPTIITQVEDTDNISWDYINNIKSANSYAVTNKPLYTISGLWQERFKTYTNQIWTTGYNIAPLGAITGVEVSMSAMRLNRIQDYIVQLCLNGELIGLNYAINVPPDVANMYSGDTGTPFPPSSDKTSYGGPLDMWGTELTLEDITNPTFGVVVALQSHVMYPHRDLGYIDQISLRVHYA
jgi:hypothetical protein